MSQSGQRHRSSDIVPHKGKPNTQELKCETPGLYWVACNPEVLQVAESDSVGVVLHVEGEPGVVNQCDGPEFGDGIDHIATLFVHRRELHLSATLCESEGESEYEL